MRNAGDRAHDDRLVHPARNHFAGARLARAARIRRGQDRCGRLSAAAHGWRWTWFGHKIIWLRSCLGAVGKHRLDPRDLAAQQTQAARLFELAALLLQTQVQTLLTQVAPLGQQLVRAHFADFFDFHKFVKTAT